MNPNFDIAAGRGDREAGGGRFAGARARVRSNRGALSGAASVFFRGGRPPLWLGMVVTGLLVAVCTALVYPLKQVTTVSSLGVVYLLGVVVVSTFWGVWLGVAMSVLSAAAFNFFHLPPVDEFTIADSRNWVALGTFLVVALASSSVAEVARARTVEAERRRAEADLTAEMAQLLLGAGADDALALIGQRIAIAFELPWASVSRDDVTADLRHEVILVRAGDRRLGTLVIPRGLPANVVERLRERVVPALAAVLTVALERERLVAEAVRTEGLQRSDAIKTAILRAVSHDLRSPVMAIMAAGTTIRGNELNSDDRHELGTLVEEESARLSRMIEDLLDLSRLEANSARPVLAECSVAELIDAALAAQPTEANFELHIDPDLPLVRADFGQIERALANLLENGRRYSDGDPVVILARAIGGWVTIRVVDRGPGIPLEDRGRIFEPFYRGNGTAESGQTGSGLGLAIAKGFTDANGGRIWVESTPALGSSFAISLPAITESAA